MINKEKILSIPNSLIFICSIVYHEVERGAITGKKYDIWWRFCKVYEDLPQLFLDSDNSETIHKAYNTKYFEQIESLKLANWKA